MTLSTTHFTPFSTYSEHQEKAAITIQKAAKEKLISNPWKNLSDALVALGPSMDAAISVRASLRGQHSTLRAHLNTDQNSNILAEIKKVISKNQDLSELGAALF